MIWLGQFGSLSLEKFSTVSHMIKMLHYYILDYKPAVVFSTKKFGHDYCLLCSQKRTLKLESQHIFVWNPRLQPFIPCAQPDRFTPCLCCLLFSGLSIPQSLWRSLSDQGHALIYLVKCCLNLDTQGKQFLTPPGCIYSTSFCMLFLPPPQI